MVSSYKNLGVDLNNELGSFMQWSRVSGLIKQNIYLLKQLKRSGLEERILVNVFKSLVLSHIRYSSVILDSCTTATKNDIQVIQNRMLRIISSKKETAYSKYGILNVSDVIELFRLEQAKRILKTQTHTLPISISSNQRSHFSFNLKIPIARTEKFNQSAVMKTL